RAELSSKTPNTIEIMHGTQSGIWGLFGDMMLVSWVYSDQKPDYEAAAKQDAAQLAAALATIVTELGLPNTTQVRYALHEGILVQSKEAASALGAQWRTLFAQAILQLEHGQSDAIQHETIKESL
ncbi:MAG TPA: molecular chaperone TorD, partial [Methylophilus sp.]